MNKLNKIIQNILSGASVFTFIFITIIACWQVASRNIFNNPAAWTEEVLTYGFVGLAMLAASLMVSKREHMRLTFIIDKLGHKTKRTFEIIHELTIILFASLVLIYGGISIIRLTMVQVTPALQVPVGLFYGILPIAGVLIVLFCIGNILNILKEKISGNDNSGLLKEGK